MQARNIIVVVGLLAVLGLVVILFLQTRAESKSAISPEKRARALAEYERRSRLEAPAAVDDDAPVTRPRARRVEAPEPDPEVPAAPVAKNRRVLGTSMARRADLATPQIKLGSGSDDPEIQEQKENVRQAYDSGNYPEAQKLSLEAIKAAPRDRKLLRYVVSASCAVGDEEVAREHAKRMVKRDFDLVSKRCRQNWGVEL